MCKNYHIPPSLKNQTRNRCQKPPVLKSGPARKTRRRARSTTVKSDKSVCNVSCANEFVFVVGMASKGPHWRTGLMTVNCEKSVSYVSCVALLSENESVNRFGNRIVSKYKNKGERQRAPMTKGPTEATHGRDTSTVTGEAILIKHGKR